MSAREFPVVVLFVIFTGLGPAANAAADNNPDWTPEGLIAQLGSDDANVRRIAAARLKNLDGTHLEAIQSAAGREDLGPGARDALKAALPPVRYRARQLKLTEEVRAYESRMESDAYERTGVKDPRWDALVKEAIALFNTPPSAEVTPARVSAAFKKALDEGCTDPLVQFLAGRAQWRADPADRDAVLALSRQAALSLPNTKHPAEFAWRAAVRFLEQSGAADQEVIAVALEALPKALAETGRPSEDIAEFIDITHTVLSRGSSEQEVFEKIYPLYANSRPANDPGPYVYKGRWYITWAWDARGTGLANTVTPQGWRLMAERLAVARASLEQAWKIDAQDPRAPTDMIRVIRGESGNKGEMEMWFLRAMNINPNNRLACSYKLRFLFPRWHGSEAEMLVFGRQCLATQNWWAPIPTVLVDAHEEVARCGTYDPKEYFGQPEVWTDIEAVYRSFLEVYPDSNRVPWYRSKLAKWACDCEQWGAARKVFVEIGDKPDLSVFRSMAVYNYYRRKAEKKSAAAQQVYADPAAD